MPKLKSLRGAIGIYGRVKANGIVEVEEKDVEKLLKSKRFVRATAADIAAAEDAQKEFLTVNMTGTAPGFAPVASPKSADCLQAMIDSGAITKEKAKELVSLQIELSADEVKAEIQRSMDEVRGEFAVRQADLTAREKDLSIREQAHADAVSAQEAEAQRLANMAADLDRREQEIAAASTSSDAQIAATVSPSKDDTKGKPAK